MPRDTTATNSACNNQGDTKGDTQDKHPSASIQTQQYKTPKSIMTSPLLPTQLSQNTHHHEEQYIPRALSAMNNT